MPLWTMVSEKQLLGQYYSNRYVIQASTLPDAVAIGQSIRDIEKAIHYDVVNFTKFRVSDQVLHTDNYQVVNDNAVGSLTLGSAEFLPLFCRIRVDFNTQSGGRPSRKYLLQPIPEANQANGVLAAGSRNQVQTLYANPLVALVGFVDVDNQAFASASVFPNVGMHQMRRGSKRKALPIIPT